MSAAPALMDAVDRVLNDDRWKPRHGWHDDHRPADRTPLYRPAMMQVRGEFMSLVEALIKAGAIGRTSSHFPTYPHTRCLQLGMGECDASHFVWLKLFDRVLTIDWRITVASQEGQDHRSFGGIDTKHSMAISCALEHGPYDLLFIDADHSFEDVKRDHEIYGPMVKPGGIIAFHDALPRDTYPEIEVWKYLQTLPGVTTAGNDVGTAWLVKE